MTLKDFLLNVKTGYSSFVISSCDDDDYGATNVSEGKYYAIDTWDVKDEADLMEEVEYLPGFIEGDWLDRTVVEIDGLAPMEAMRKYFENGYKDSLAVRPVINIAVKYTREDAEIWEDPENLEEPILNNIAGGVGFPIGDEWPYDLSKDVYDSLNELLHAGRKRILSDESWSDLGYPAALFFMEAVTTIFNVGFRSVQKATDEDFATAEAEAKEGTADDRRNFRVEKYAKEIVDASPSLEALMQFIAISPDLAMFVKAERE